MGVDNLCLSLSVYRFLALRILSADDQKRGSSDVTFFFVGTFFGIAVSAAVACSPSFPQCVRNEERAERTEVYIPLARSFSRSVSLGTFRECHRSKNSMGTISYCNSRHSAMRIFHLSRPQLGLGRHPLPRYKTPYAIDHLLRFA